ncbi:SusC/RagA family TonB-linked outer membrane protein [Pseudoflavitalea sp. G-6-1-2]|uniref:SusC/RagA family TonB-linked outer membrane protein n=1 Tax=Pseudoflavitalea sp. G-6-1-2 TaxID=2728841 RepID=UPI00146C1018|nr:SusC/RagA family TonB-linked outer membrane protein [Pseudoflavitalea sp. G-6-1-2]NML22777.1 SusC/RagA family TonB-linked outer membrane protein [Pseudoflavitalea sp. G-6-1-2]
MKLTIVLLTTMLTCAYATGLSQSVTFTGKEVPLKQVFAVIENQTGYVVFLNRDILNDAKPVTIAAKQMPLAEFLSAVLKEQPFDFLIEGKTIVLSPKKIIPPAILLFDPPGRDVSGFVYDAKTSAPIRGVNISVNGTNKATQSDERGNFMLKNIEGDISITLTSIGYEKQIVKVTDKNSRILVALRMATSELDQAVVQAYGITSKRLSTGNIVKVTGEEIRRQPVMNPMAALQGKVPGLELSYLTGNASSPIKIQIRGRNSINSNVVTEPLYVIDGIPQTVLESGIITNNRFGVSQGYIQNGISYTQGQSPFFNINPKDIESIEVLKDADATAIYGSRAANGVILITTKKAQAGRTAFDVSIQQGVVTVPRYPRMMSLREYIDMRYEAFRNDGITPTVDNAPDLLVWDTTRSTNWIRQLLRTGNNTDIGATLSGGDMRTSFRLSSGYTEQRDLNTRTGGNKRGTLHLNVKHATLNQKLTISLMAAYASTKVDAISDPVSGYTTAPNAPPIFDESGKLNYKGYNPNPNINNFTFDYILKPNIQKTNSLNSNLTINYTLFKGLILTGSFNYQNMNNTNDIFQPVASQDPNSSPRAIAIFGNTKNSNVAFEPQINYTRAISKGRLSVMLAGTLQKTSTNTTNITGLGFPNDDQMKSISLAQAVAATNTQFDFKYAAVFSRINFNWDQKYILNLQMRRDGSSRFAPGSQYGNFGSIGASWIASEEEWMKRMLPSWFSFIKLRMSYGITGSDNVGNYEYLARYGTLQQGSTTRMFPYGDVQPYVSVVPVNQQYRWEELRSLDAGINLGFWDDRISVDFTYVRKRSGNQLTQLPTPSYTGFNLVRANWGATVQNKGIEAAMRIDVIKKKNLLLALNANITRNTNKLIAYPGLENSPFANRLKLGTSLNMQYVKRVTGVDPLTGEISFEDYNKDGVITTNTNVFPGTGNDDNYVGYDVSPDFFGGFGADLTWKNFGLSMQFNYSKQLSPPVGTGLSIGRMANLILPDDLLTNHWRKPGDISRYPKFTTIGDNRGAEYVSSSYLRLNAVQISYAMPEKLTKKAGLKGCNFSLNISNLFTITSYGADPSVLSGSFNPIPRIIVGRINFTL